MEIVPLIQSNYLEKLDFAKGLTQDGLITKLDKAWDFYELNNENLDFERLGDFYSHPVWILNGLFSEIDSASCQHRQAIASCITQTLKSATVADFGGGSGVLAKFIADHPDFEGRVTIIEPYPNKYFQDALVGQGKVSWATEASESYDICIAQDVLEHLVDPLAYAENMISHTHLGGYLIFANNFYPVIKCHLPSTFYLRHTFKYLMRIYGLEYQGVVKGCEHALIFKRSGLAKYSNQSVWFVCAAKIIGRSVNRARAWLSVARRFSARGSL